MFKGYFVEIQVDTNTTMYLAPGGYSSYRYRPYFFSSRYHVNRALGKKWNKPDPAKTKVVEVIDLEKGMKNATAKVYTLTEWQALPPPSKSPKGNPRCQYKIEYNPSVSRINRFFGGNSARPFGKVWETAGDVRRYITGHLHYLSSSFKDATVIEMEYEPDMMTQKAVRRIPIVEFYCLSPDSRKRYDDAFKSTLTTFEPNPNPKSPYA